MMLPPESFQIVVTDTNHHVRNFLHRELEKDRYTVSSIKTADQVKEYLLSATPLHLIILDPELFPFFEDTMLSTIARHRPTLQVIIHTYADLIGTIQPGKSIYLVTKDGQSIGPIKAIIRNCFQLFRKQRWTRS
jgi:response regulator RpfG family c-di-GMP phosphodiesterase